MDVRIDPTRTVELMRSVRFCLSGQPHAKRPPVSNSFAAWPPMEGLGRFYQLHARAVGRPDPITGYFLDIKAVDRAVRDHALPLIDQALADDAQHGAGVPMGKLMLRLFEAVDQPLDGQLEELIFELTPFYHLSCRRETLPRVNLANQYEFAASHRLHVPEFSDEENRKTFGKCNNPAGHGHNYRFEVIVSVPVDERGGLPSITQLDDLVSSHVLEVLDHTHLNSDVSHFANLNPSVENIACVIYSLLQSPIQSLATTPGTTPGSTPGSTPTPGRAPGNFPGSTLENTPGQAPEFVAESPGGASSPATQAAAAPADAGVYLEAVTVWETDKTSCTYRGR